MQQAPTFTATKQVAPPQKRLANQAAHSIDPKQYF